MGDPAVDTKVDPLNVEGLEDIFAKDGPQNDQETTWTVLDQTEQNTSSVQDGPGKLVHPISVEEAANILKISPNAVCKRLRKGSLLGNKIPGKFKDEWLVEGAGLIEILSIDVKQKQDSSDEAPPREQHGPGPNHSQQQNRPGRSKRTHLPFTGPGRKAGGQTGGSGWPNWLSSNTVGIPDQTVRNKGITNQITDRHFPPQKYLGEARKLVYKRQNVRVPRI